MEKLRIKLEREINSQKPKLAIVNHKKEELCKRLALCASKENELSNDIESAMQNIGNEYLKQIVCDAMRMKQLEVKLITPMLILSLKF